MEGWSEVPVEVGLWRVDGNKPVKVTPSGVPLESQLEAMIEADPTSLGTPLLLVGRQVPTDFGKSLPVRPASSWVTAVAESGPCRATRPSSDSPSRNSVTRYGGLAVRSASRTRAVPATFTRRRASTSRPNRVSKPGS